MVRTLVHGSSLQELIALFVGVSAVPAIPAQLQPAVVLPSPAGLPSAEPPAMNATHTKSHSHIED